MLGFVLGIILPIPKLVSRKETDFRDRSQTFVRGWQMQILSQKFLAPPPFSPQKNSAPLLAIEIMGEPHEKEDVFKALAPLQVLKL